MDTLGSYLDFLRQPRVYRLLLAAAAVSVAVLYFTSYIVTAALVLGVAAVAWTMNRAGMKRVGIELSTLSTVLIGVSYGPVVGAAMGFAVIMLQVTAGQYTGSYIIWVIPSYAVAGLLSGVMSSMDVFVLGMGLTVGMQAIFAALTSFTASGRLQAYLPYAVTNVVFNLLVFRYVAPVLLPLMT